MSTVGERIRLVRRRHSGMSQAQLAHKAGIHPNSLSNIERGATLHVPEGTRRKIADALGVSLEELDGSSVASPRGEALHPFVEEFRAGRPDLFAGWAGSDWDRFLILLEQFGSATPSSAEFMAAQVNKERRVVAKMHVLFDANCADAIVSAIDQAHAAVVAAADSEPGGAAAVRVIRGDRAHRTPAPPH